MKLLTVALVLVTAAVAGCSSTTAGPDGAIQDDVELAASPPASSPAGPTSSPAPVTPSPGPTEAPASPVASPTDSPAGSESPDDPALLGGSFPGSNDVCESGMEYECGGIGQSGVGTVFYASTIPFSCVANGVDLTSSCNYLEVAPNGWNGDLVDCRGGCGGKDDKTSDFGKKGIGTGRGYAYCSTKGETKDSKVIQKAQATSIGTGYPNTSALLAVCKSGDAAEQVRGYEGGGMTDWSLPSKDELNALYSYNGRDQIGGFAAFYYWSSSNSYSGEGWWQHFSDGYQNANHGIDSTYGVRPVRSF